MFREMLLDVLSGPPASDVVEKAYLAGYRSRLEQIVHPQTTQSRAAGRQPTSIGRSAAHY
jgi:hypothetical protein